MAANSEIRYLTPLTVDTKKKKYCRFKRSGIKYIDYKNPEFVEVPASCGQSREACPPPGSSSLRNRPDEITVLSTRQKRFIMKLILKENIAGLGYKDDVVEVKDGYGRNYLIPQGKAIVASKAALKQLAEDQKQRVHKIAKIKADAEAAAQALEGIKLTIAAKTSATGTIFGSVNSIQIAEALLKLGHEVVSEE